MAPEYGATMGFFPVDARTVEYFKGTGRTAEEIAAFEAYFKAQGLFGIPRAGDIDYSSVVTLDLSSVAPSLAGPKRPQDRIEITHLSKQFRSLFSAPVAQNGFNQPADKLARRYPVAQANGATASDKPAPAPGAPRDVVEMVDNRATRAATHAKPSGSAPSPQLTIGNGDVLIAAITS